MAYLTGMTIPLACANKDFAEDITVYHSILL